MAYSSWRVILISRSSKSLICVSLLHTSTYKSIACHKKLASHTIWFVFILGLKPCETLKHLSLLVHLKYLFADVYCQVLQLSKAYNDAVECYKNQRNKVSRLKKRIARTEGFKEYKKIIDSAKFTEEKIRRLKVRSKRLIGRIEQIEPTGWKEFLQVYYYLSACYMPLIVLRVVVQLFILSPLCLLQHPHIGHDWMFIFFHWVKSFLFSSVLAILPCTQKKEKRIYPDIIFTKLTFVGYLYHFLGICSEINFFILQFGNVC